MLFLLKKTVYLYVFAVENVLVGVLIFHLLAKLIDSMYNCLFVILFASLDDSGERRVVEVTLGIDRCTIENLVELKYIIHI